MPAGADIDWAEFFALYRALAVRLALGITAHPALAEDLAQEAARSTFERARAGELAVESREHARNYFLRAVRNLAASALRGRRGAGGTEIARAAPSPEPGPLDLAAARERDAGERLRALLGGLPAAEREALALRYLEGLSYREMSARCAAPISTLQARVEAGLRKIRGRIGNEDPDA